MDALIIVAAIVVGFIALAVAAVTWGVDSRESFVDDHGR
jgi:nitrogen fixation-related uncharacterized protein